MLKSILFAVVFSACFVMPVQAQTEAALPAVDGMTCEQMMAEMTVAGQHMNAHLDPEFATEAQAMHAQAQSRRSDGSTAEQNQARMGAQMDRLNDSTQGLDMQR
jgi:hypothetical protein